jgi:hypothetical protein
MSSKQASPALALVEHFHRIDELERQAVQRGLDSAAGRHELPLGEDALAFLADHEIVVEQGGMRMRRTPGDGDAVRARDRGRQHEPVERRAFLLQLLCGEVVNGQSERHLAGGDEVGKQGMASTHRDAVPGGEGAKQSKPLALAQLLHHGSEPVLVAGFDRKPALPARSSEIDEAAR